LPFLSLVDTSGLIQLVRMAGIPWEFYYMA
jgi:hypothetical protein